MSPPLEMVLAPEVQAILRAEIEAAGGAEVFFLGRCNPAGVVIEVEVAARGSRSAVPALLARAVGYQAAIHNHPSGDLRPSEGDLRAAALLANLGLGFLIVNDAVSEAFEAIPLPRRRPSRLTASAPPRPPSLEPGQVAEFFAEGGPLSHVLGPAYEPRPQQVDLARAVAEAFRRDGIGLFEAGTGTGKTFAYLVPAALLALRGGEKVVISTATKNLQGQLSRKDVPALQAALRAAGLAPPRGETDGGAADAEEREPLRVAVAKGRSNYVSLRRAEEAGRQEELAFGDDHERQEVLRLAAWARETRSGDRVELVPPPSSEAWDHVNSTSDNCLGRECPRYRDCHFFSQRRRAHAAQVLIANHHLLFSDLAIKLGQGFDQAAVLPPFTRVILDEAHHVEDIASEYFGLQLTEFALARPLGQLEGRRGRGRGLLPALQGHLRGENLERLARTLEERIRPLREDVLRSVEDAFHLVALELRHGLPPGQREAREVKLRVTEELVPLFAPLEDARAALVLLVSRLGRLLDEAKPILSLAQEEASRSLRLQVRGLLRRLERGATGLEEFLGGIGYRVAPLELGGVAAPARAQGSTQPEGQEEGAASQPEPAQAEGDQGGPGTEAPAEARLESEQIRWIELYRDRRRRDRLKLRSAPLEVGPHLVPALFAPARSVVLTSATLAVAGGTEFLEARLGLDRWRREFPARPLLQAQIPSPFDYPRQALLAVPSDLPLPDRSDYAAATTGALDALLECSRGRAFALFTSYGALQRAFQELAPRLEARGLLPLCQGSQSRESLLERFRATRGAVLFGTDSFWEGVDVPGDALVLVVIAKLPFGVPSEPLQIARAEAVAARGGSPFQELALPQAVLKLKQGFGRLIRGHQDRGAVVVLDRRLVTRAYGQAFLESLPPARLEVAPLRDVLVAVRRITAKR